MSSPLQCCCQGTSSPRSSGTASASTKPPTAGRGSPAKVTRSRCLLPSPLASAGPFLLLFALKNRPPCPHSTIMWDPCVPFQGGPQRSIPKLCDSCFTLGLPLHAAALNILRLPWHEKLRNQCPKVAKHRGYEVPNSLLTFAAGGNRPGPLPVKSASTPTWPRLFPFGIQSQRASYLSA